MLERADNVPDDVEIAIGSSATGLASSRRALDLIPV
jgi:hypothetical protein